VVLTAGMWLVVGGALAWAAAAPRQDTEEGLLAKIPRERHPVKKGKLEVRLGRVKLLQAMEAFDSRDIEKCYRLLGAYQERMKSAWATLEGSGRPAWKKPQGFKELDIALREDARLLEDFKHRVPYQAREPVEKAAREIEQLRGLVLKALFPPVPPDKPRQNLLPGKRTFPWELPRT